MLQLGLRTIFLNAPAQMFSCANRIFSISWVHRCVRPRARAFSCARLRLLVFNKTRLRSSWNTQHLRARVYLLAVQRVRTESSLSAILQQWQIALARQPRGCVSGRSIHSYGGSLSRLCSPAYLVRSVRKCRDTGWVRSAWSNKELYNSLFHIYYIAYMKKKNCEMKNVYKLNFRPLHK